MNNTLKYISLFFLFSFLIFSCALPGNQPPPKIDYYTLEYDSPEIHIPSPLPVVIGIQRFQVAPSYNTTKIIYREKKFKRNTYTYHRWRANPGELVSYFLARDLQQASLSRAAFTLDKKIPATHIVEGTVDEFYEHDADTTWEAVLSVSITLLKENEPDISRRVLSQKRYSIRKPCRRKNPQALAEAMSSAMSQTSSMIINDIYKALAKGK